MILAQTFLRAAFLWIVVRITFTAFGALVPRFNEAPAAGWRSVLEVEPATAALVALVVGVLVLADIRALRERTFLANLGIALHVVAGLSVVTALMLESIVAITLRFA